MEVNTVNCLFCALPCSPDFVINKRNHVKTEHVLLNGEDVTSLSIAFGGEDEVVEEHLKAVFILRKILKIPQDVLYQFLRKGNGQFYPELWFNVCQSCGEAVTQFYAVLKQISKLERKLTTIQTELKGKIEESKTVDNKDFVWGKIREEALKDYSPQFGTEECEISAVKTENVPFIITETGSQAECMSECPDEDDIKSHSHLDDDEDDATFGETNEDTFDDDQSNDPSYQPPFTDQSSSSPRHTMPQDDDDDQEEIQFVTDFNPLDFQAPRTKGYFYACQQCSYQSNTKADFEAHQRLHEEGSGAIICNICGRPVLEEKMERHNSFHFRIGAYRQRFRARAVIKTGTTAQPGTHLTNNGASSSNLSSGKYYYQCGQCPFESNSSLRFAKHKTLHEDGSGAISCKECGFYLDPTKVGLHRSQRHNYRRDYTIARKKTSGVVKNTLK